MFSAKCHLQQIFAGRPSGRQAWVGLKSDRAYKAHQAKPHQATGVFHTAIGPRAVESNFRDLHYLMR